MSIAIARKTYCFKVRPKGLIKVLWIYRVAGYGFYYCDALSVFGPKIQPFAERYGKNIYIWFLQEPYGLGTTLFWSDPNSEDRSYIPEAMTKEISNHLCSAEFRVTPQILSDRII